MPRKKYPKPTPIAIYSDEDYVVEVYEDGQLPKGRGLHGHYRRIQTLHLALEVLLDARDQAKAGFQKKKFLEIRQSAVALERELAQKHGRRHHIQIQQRICRSALRIYGLTGDDAVRLPYLLR
jgi:hypothetical protein